MAELGSFVQGSFRRTLPMLRRLCGRQRSVLRRARAIFNSSGEPEMFMTIRTAHGSYRRTLPRPKLGSFGA